MEPLDLFGDEIMPYDSSQEQLSPAYRELHQRRVQDFRRSGLDPDVDEDELRLWTVEGAEEGGE